MMVDEPADYMADQIGKMAAFPVPWEKLARCGCGLILVAPADDDCIRLPCDVCIKHAKATGGQVTMGPTVRRDTAPLIAVCVLVLLCTAIIANSIQGMPTRPRDPMPTMEGS